MPKRKEPGTATRAAKRRAQQEAELEVQEAEPEVQDTVPDQNEEAPDDSSGDEADLITPVVSVYSKLGENVSEGTRTKIIEGKYVNLGTLLKRGPQDGDEQKVIIKNGQLITKSISSEKIISIEMWTDAFIVFIAIYGTVHPAKIPGLLKYMDSVRVGARRCNGLGWKSYDEQYRLRKSSNPESDWAKIDDELWLLYMNDRFPVPQSRYQPRFNTRTSGKCFDFNNKWSCFRYPCHYLHTCLNCSGDHPSVMCTQRQPFLNPASPTPTRSPYPGINPRMPFKGTRGRGRGQGYMGPGSHTHQK
ncbi:uncharacterized protein LOC110466217 [Mizuhopecten yessoensis]|uniref:uncharacterized protein LOC110466217 n=1 Tax=Mizuhopecten yessoensis TaxID=6573 RepID=UPI000B457185|nr:uncharacterized protein LOC110466217 [Mizuhopecten yessoensis]